MAVTSLSRSKQCITVIGKMVVRLPSKFFGRRRKWLIPIIIWTVLLLITYQWLGELRRALLPPAPDQDLDHFRRSTKLMDYLDHIYVLIQPSSVSCTNKSPLVLVASAPSHYEHRHVIRNTWGKHLHTYFVMGIQGDDVDENMADNYIEAKEHSDIIIYNLHDHYQNLTLKSVLMLQWTEEHCPGVSFLFKTDDDVLVNPWTLEKVLVEHAGAPLLGYMRNNSHLHRDAYNKWFVPRYLHPTDYLPRYLSGTGYLINGAYIKPLLEEAKKVPLINLEDVYLTHLVADSKLKYKLVHDYRLSPFKPWINMKCAFWTLASIHSFKPSEMVEAWKKIEEISQLYKKDREVCSFYKKYIESEYLLY